jgi:hypothetical protein
MRPIARRSLLALLLSVAAAQALAVDELGTLFNTPEERARLDRLRRGEPAAVASTPGSAFGRKPSLTGYVQRSDGRNTVWIDGRPVVVASPDARSVLQPNMVHPRASERVLRAEDPDKEER